MGDSSALIPLPKQPDGVAWPMPDWPRAEVDARVDRDALDRVLRDGLAAPELGTSRALLVIQNGAIVAEHYGEDLDASSTHRSWSMAKSWLHAMVGILVRDGKLEVDAPAPVPEWSDPADPRHAITLGQLLEMRSGLHFIEDYVEQGGAASVTDMLFGTGKDDVAAYAAACPLGDQPGAVFYYSSGTSNIVARLAHDAAQARGDDWREFMRRELLGPIGATSPRPKFDAAGTWIGSSFMPATARDFARLGLLYLRDGVWDGQRILPEGWADYARKESGRDDEGHVYGAHFWVVPDGLGTFQCQGYDGQRTIMVPALDLIIVRLGQTALENRARLNDFMTKLVECFRASAR